MSGLARFVREGLGDADRRISRRLPPAVTDHPFVFDAIGAGVAAGWIARLAAIGRAACESSIALGALRSMQSAWGSAHWSARRRTLGLLLLTAVAVHGTLAMWGDRPAGWIWTLVPGLIAAIAVLLLMAGTSSAGVHDR
jgi:hypothetical protein